jgi:hypothetical protein
VTIEEIESKRQQTVLGTMTYLRHEIVRDLESLGQAVDADKLKQYEKDKIKTLGLKWTEAGSEKLTEGAQITNQTLAVALQSKVEFAKDEMEKIQLAHLSSDSYIKVSDSYFKPTDEKPKSSSDVIEEEERTYVQLLQNNAALDPTWFNDDVCIDVYLCVVSTHTGGGSHICCNTPTPAASKRCCNKELQQQGFA